MRLSILWLIILDLLDQSSPRTTLILRMDHRCAHLPIASRHVVLSQRALRFEHFAIIAGYSLEVATNSMFSAYSGTVGTG